MAFDLPLDLQNTHVNITVLVVDDDPIFLSIIPNMLKNPSCKDESFGEITVMTANDSSEAVSTLRGQCNNIDVVITDYHMPGLNGVQLKKRIEEEFGNLPVIVISADMNNEIEQETLSSGAVCFMRKPIKPNDLNIICQHALDHKMNEIQKTDSTSNSDDGDSVPEATKKTKIKWTGALETHFCKAIQHIGVHKATPKKIIEFMNLDYLTRAHVASKLQKYRKFLRKVKDEGVEKARRAMVSNLRSSSCIKPQRSYNSNTSRNKIDLFNSQPGYGLGQSSQMMKNKPDFHGSVNYKNRGPTYNLSQTGSNLLATGGSLGFPNGMFPLKEDWRSISGTSQESQPLRFGKYGTPSDVLGMNSNLTMGTAGNNYAGIRIDEEGDVVGLGGIRFNGNGNGSIGGIRVHGTGSLGGIQVGDGSLGGMQVHGTGDGSLGGIQFHGIGDGSLGGIQVHGTGDSSLGGIQVHGTGDYSLGGIQIHGTGDGSLGGIQVHGTGDGSLGGIQVHGNGDGSLSEIQVHGTGDDSLGGIQFHGTGDGSIGGIQVHGTSDGSLGGIQVHGTSNGNGSLGENLGGMTWNFNNKNLSNHGSSASRFPSALSSFLDNKDESQNYLNAQTGGVVPVLENPKIFNDHNGIDEFFCDTINSQFDQNQHQGNVTGESLEVSTAYPLEDINNGSFNNGNYNEETLNSLAANSEMYYPTDQDMNITNQEHGVADFSELPLLFDQGFEDENFMKYYLKNNIN